MCSRRWGSIRPAPTALRVRRVAAWGDVSLPDPTTPGPQGKKCAKKEVEVGLVHNRAEIVLGRFFWLPINLSGYPRRDSGAGSESLFVMGEV
jgi:hypothetical protein